MQDNNGYVVTVGGSISTLSRFDVRNLSLINQTTMAESSAMVIRFINNAYFTGFSSDPIVVIDSRNLTVLNTINSSFIRGVRDIMFLDQGRTMVTSATYNQTIVFFTRVASSLSGYAFAYQKSVSYLTVHGLNRINDTFFYATSWTQSSV